MVVKAVAVTVVLVVILVEGVVEEAEEESLVFDILIYEGVKA